MTWGIEVALLLLILICAIGALQIKDLLGAAIVFGAYSFLICCVWAGVGAVDVAFTEVTVGAGVSTIFFVATALHVARRSKD